MEIRVFVYLFVDPILPQKFLENSTQLCVIIKTAIYRIFPDKQMALRKQIL